MTISIIVTYNGIQWIEKCLGSLIGSTAVTDIVVIDNASTDSTTSLIKSKFPRIHLIENKENLGFAIANNIGIKYAMDKGADFIFLLNQDAWVEIDTIDKLLNVFESEPDAGIVSPIHLNGSNSGLDYGFTNCIYSHNTPGFISDLYFNRLQRYYKTEFVNAAAWLISSKCIKIVGGFDTSLFSHYGEDNNYCQRVRYNNFGIYINTETIIHHNRDYRNGEHPDIYKSMCETISRKVYYSNPMLDDEIINSQIHSLKSNYKRTKFKLFTLLKYRKLREFKKYIEEELEFFYEIRKSRIAYKTGGNNWLDKNSV